MQDAAKGREWWIKGGVFPTPNVFWAEVWAAELARRADLGAEPAAGPPKPDEDPNEGW